jgi:hypothetical protein
MRVVTIARASGEQVMVQATNFGPGKFSLRALMLRRTSWWRTLLRRTSQGFLMYDYQNPLSSKLPITLDVGEQASYIFPFKRSQLFGVDFEQVGLTDSFGRAHWAPRKEFAKARQRWLEDFSTKES